MMTAHKKPSSLLPYTYSLVLDHKSFSFNNSEEEFLSKYLRKQEKYWNPSFSASQTMVVFFKHLVKDKFRVLLKCYP